MPDDNQTAKEKYLGDSFNRRPVWYQQIQKCLVSVHVHDFFNPLRAGKARKSMIIWGGEAGVTNSKHCTMQNGAAIHQQFGGNPGNKKTDADPVKAEGKNPFHVQHVTHGLVKCICFVNS